MVAERAARHRRPRHTKFDRWGEAGLFSDDVLDNHTLAQGFDHWTQSSSASTSSLDLVDSKDYFDEWDFNCRLPEHSHKRKERTRDNPCPDAGYSGVGRHVDDSRRESGRRRRIYTGRELRPERHSPPNFVADPFDEYSTSWPTTRAFEIHQPSFFQRDIFTGPGCRLKTHGTRSLPIHTLGFLTRPLSKGPPDRPLGKKNRTRHLYKRLSYEFFRVKRTVSISSVDDVHSLLTFVSLAALSQDQRKRLT